LPEDDWWVEPTSFEHALEIRIQLINEIEGIQAQLGNRVRRENARYDEDYDRWIEYMTWRGQATWAWTRRLARLREVKEYINEHSERRISA
jgi:hypothetical protein